MADTGILTTPQQFATDAGATVTDASTPAPDTTTPAPVVAAPLPATPATPAVSTPTAPTSVAPQATETAPVSTTPGAPMTAAQFHAQQEAAQAASGGTSSFTRLSNAQYKALSLADQETYNRQKAQADATAAGFSKPAVSQNQWNGMSPQQRQAYIAANPNSPEAAGKGAALGTPAAVNAAQAASNAASGGPANQTAQSGVVGAYQPPPPAQASTYTSNQNFIPSLPANEPTATNWDVTPEQTVQGQMKQLTTNLQTNPVYQSLADQLKRTAAASGGGNSLMAETAAYNTVIGLAYNIATADAATYAKSAEFNASMANQFGLAEQQFMNTAALSDQNYKQSQVLQSNQIKGNLDSVDRQVAGQLESTSIASAAQVEAAGLQANATTASASIYADASVQNAQLASTTSLTEADIQRQTTLDSIQGQFDANWALGQEQTAGQLQVLGVQQAGNMATTIQQGVQQITLQTNADQAANLRQAMAGVAQVGATPGLTPAQQAQATKTIVDMASTNNALGAAAAGTATHGIADGTIAGALDPTLQPTKSVAPTADNPYGIYGNYMTFPGYDVAPPPTLPLFGGTGATSNVGKQTGDVIAQPAVGGPFIKPPPPLTAAPP